MTPLTNIHPNNYCIERSCGNLIEYICTSLLYKGGNAFYMQSEKKEVSYCGYYTLKSNESAASEMRLELLSLALSIEGLAEPWVGRELSSIEQAGTKCAVAAPQSTRGWAILRFCVFQVHYSSF